MRLAALLFIVPFGALAEGSPCTPAAATATVEVSLKKGAKVKDLAAWYHRVSCRDIEAPLAIADAPLTLAIEGKISAARALEVVRAAAASVGYDVRSDGRSVTLQVERGEPALPSETSCSVDPSGVTTQGDTVTIDGAKAQGVTFDCLTRTVRVVPAMKDGAVSGLRLFAIRRGSLLALIGFENGDTLKTINGRAVNSPDKALEVYTSLREEKKFDVALERRGERKALSIVVK